MELTNEEKTIIISVLNQISCPISQAKSIFAIIDKLTEQIQNESK